MKLPNLKIHRRWSGDYRDSSVRYLEIKGKLYRPVYQFQVWGPQTDKRDGVVKLFRSDAIANVGGHLYRMGDKVARPMVLAAEEFLMPFGWADGRVIMPLDDPEVKEKRVSQ